MQNITLEALLDLFLFRLKWLLLGLVCGALLASAYTVFWADDQYTAEISLFVQNTDEDTGMATTSNLYASRMLTNSYAVILRDAQTILMMTERITEPATAAQITSALRISTTEDSAIIQVKAVSSDAVFAQAVCQAVCDVSSDVLLDTVGSGTVTPLGDVMPAVKTGPNHVRNVILGAALGFMLVAVISFIIFLSDTTIKHKEDLRRFTDMPLLGEIPSLQMHS